MGCSDSNCVFSNVIGSRLFTVLNEIHFSPFYWIWVPQVEISSWRGTMPVPYSDYWYWPNIYMVTYSGLAKSLMITRLGFGSQYWSGTWKQYWSNTISQYWHNTGYTSNYNSALELAVSTGLVLTSSTYWSSTISRY